MEEREGVGLYKGKGKHYNNVALSNQKVTQEGLAFPSPKRSPKESLRLGQNGPNAGTKAASREDAKAAFHKRTKVIMT